MNWYKISQFKNLSAQQLKMQINKLFEEWRPFYYKVRDGQASTEEIQKEQELEKQIKLYEYVFRQKLEEERENTSKKILEGSPHEVSRDNFLDYHKTGDIVDSAYDDYKTIEGLSWLGKPSDYPILHLRKKYGDEVIEFKKKKEKLRYVKMDENKEIIRDDKGLATYLSDEEMKDRGYPLYSTGITVFNEKGQPIGFASNEFGTDGIWVSEPYQGKGIGTDLLHEFRKQFSHKRRIGQMTGPGRIMTRAYHRRLVQEAIKNNKFVPREVLEGYQGEKWADQILERKNELV